jgi:simple sugar transport system ATP-binding protein
MSAPFITLSSISKTFGGVRSLNGVDMAFNPGEAIALAGENGSGKSTLIKVLSGVHVPTTGSIVIDDKPHAMLQPIDAVRAGIQVIYQDFSLFPNLTVAENIVFTHQLSTRQRWYKRRDVRQIASSTLERLQVSISPDALVENLSVAKKQLVAIARALVDEARLIVMDEPTTALTEAEVQHLLDVIRWLKQSGVAVLFVSHKLREVFSVCDRIVVLRNGEKVAEGPTSQFDSSSLARHMTGRDLPEARQAFAEASLGGEVLCVKDIQRRSEFSNVSFVVRAGEVVGLAGLLGSGRTALAKAIFGLDPIDSGEIAICGKNVRVDSPQTAIALGLGHVPEDRLTEGLFFGQTVKTNIEAGLLDRFVGRFGYVDKRALATTIIDWLGRLNVKGQPQQAIHALSGGNQQRVVLARWLAQEPKVLILNGPTVGVDVGSKTDIHHIIADYARGGMATLLISDDLNELVTCCNRVLVMNKGSIKQEISGADLSEARLADAIAA